MARWAADEPTSPEANCERSKLLKVLAADRDADRRRPHRHDSAGARAAPDARRVAFGIVLHAGRRCTWAQTASLQSNCFLAAPQPRRRLRLRPAGAARGAVRGLRRERVAAARRADAQLRGGGGHLLPGPSAVHGVLVDHAAEERKGFRGAEDLAAPLPGVGGALTHPAMAPPPAASASNARSRGPAAAPGVTGAPRNIGNTTGAAAAGSAAA
eukprot:CAMPEP_0176071464 /NCGR_PEP_ID=MMETSP0120_2-20121206/35694_1 /TAXON_ID=160619 /ORGANISM="Kryptoperidinium foliaceum, Strain CCMP 1326" /LENGTH=212 /DNA_ID=CAMNT_0017405121 /DNA_START=195 /DNA_END=831 /DNA_ORIENTATION=-